ncbi:unnamed protein product [Ectocarpus sp. CCAP 1310/34]|nr:unnamed protein product [Ectocarpus sp. CCAP 1310/34]
MVYGSASVRHRRTAFDRRPSCLNTNTDATKPLCCRTTVTTNSNGGHRTGDQDDRHSDEEEKEEEDDGVKGRHHAGSDVHCCGVVRLGHPVGSRRRRNSRGSITIFDRRPPPTTHRSRSKSRTGAIPPVAISQGSSISSSSSGRSKSSRKRRTTGAGVRAPTRVFAGGAVQGTLPLASPVLRRRSYRAARCCCRC